MLLATNALSAAQRFAFVTSVSGKGKLELWDDAGGETNAAAGDAICRARALAAMLDNHQLFKAWLGTPVADPFCRLHGLTGIQLNSCNGQLDPAAILGPWQRRDGKPFAGESRTLLADRHVYYPIALDENGTQIAAFYWTGGDTASTCQNWTSEVGPARAARGYTLAVGASFNLFDAGQCSFTSHLLCLEAAPGEVVPLPAQSGYLIFLASTTGNGDLATWTGSGAVGGLLGADSVCRSLAIAAELPAPTSFIAWLSVPGLPAGERFPWAGGFVRPDGIEVAASLEQLVNPIQEEVQPATGIVTDERGEYVLLASNERSWTGTSWDGSVAGPCGNWDFGFSSLIATVGNPDIAGPLWTFSGGASCDQQQHHIYCVGTTYVLSWDNFERGDLTRWSNY